MQGRPDPELIRIVRSVLDRAERGDLPGARGAAQAALDIGPDAPMLHALAGMLACRAGEPEAGIDHLRRALAASPDDLATRANLVQALVDTGNTQAALEACPPAAAARDPSLRLWRLRGHVAREQGYYAGAIAAYSAIVRIEPLDSQSWNNLGNVYALAGDRQEAVEALDRAVQLRPDLAAVRVNHAAALAEAGREGEAVDRLYACLRDFPDEGRAAAELGSLLARLHREEEALRILERAVELLPDDPDLRVRLGQQRIALIDLDGAESAFREALRLAPGHEDAHVQLAILYDYANRLDDLRALAASMPDNVRSCAAEFVQGVNHLRAAAFDEALKAFRRVPDTVDPIRRDLFIGQCHDRLGNADAAFAAFASMNRHAAADPSDPVARARLYRRALARDAAQATPAWFARWRDVGIAADGYAAPVFLVGFPRSGTTLLDTLLMGHSDITVMEELPVLSAAQERLGSAADLATIDTASLRAARARYFELACTMGGWNGRSLLVDKMPLNLNKVPLIHRLFPDARFIMALRHPCDVVLSCFTTTFKPNNAMANFLALETTAALYDRSFAFWSQCRAALPLSVHEVAYERVVADAATELRPVLAFLGLEWHDGLLDHRATVQSRGTVVTASYAQVSEPLYARSVGRWRRYERHLAPVLPILAPWIDRFGYAT